MNFITQGSVKPEQLISTLLVLIFAHQEINCLQIIGINICAHTCINIKIPLDKCYFFTKDIS